MIVISASMKKAGSGWYFNLTNDLLVRAGQPDVRVLRDEYQLKGVLKGRNCQVDLSNPVRATGVLRPYLAGHTFPIKTHGRPRFPLQTLIRWGLAKATYIYRDPRDVALSMLDHAVRLRSKGIHGNVLSKLFSLEDALRHIRDDALPIWKAWTACEGVLMVQYESMLENPRGEMQRLVDYLGLRISPETQMEILSAYRREELTAKDRDNLHLNKGVANRFRRSLSTDEIALCDAYLGEYLPSMGYAPVAAS